jgi:hypothetical protein
MTDLAQSATTVRPHSKLRLAAIAAALSCLLAVAVEAPTAGAAFPTVAQSQVSQSKRVNLRKRNLKRHTYGPKKTVTTTPAPATTPATPSAPSTPTTPTAPTTPTKPTKPTTPTQPTTPTTPTAPSTPTTPNTPTTPTVPTAESIFTGAKIKDFSLTQAAPGAITEVADPAGGSEKVLKMTVSNKDVAPITPTENPRAQLLTPDLIKSGQEFWLQTKFFLPQDFPSSVPGWMALVEIYGEPFGGSSPWQIDIEGNNISWTRNRTYKYDTPWQMPISKGRWITILLHERFAADGWTEMWVDGAPVKFFSGGSYNPNKVAATEHLPMQTMDSSNNGSSGNAAKIMNYRQAGMFESTTIYFGALRIGTTRASVGG